MNEKTFIENLTNQVGKRKLSTKSQNDESIHVEYCAERITLLYVTAVCTLQDKFAAIVDF